MRLLRLSLVLVLATAACTQPTATPQASPSSPGPVAGPQCRENTKDAKHITFGATKLAGLVWGTGSTGLLLAHQNQASVCQWLNNAREWVAQGYKVMAFDFSGFGGSPYGSPGKVSDVVEAVKAFRAEGVSRIILIGASLGAVAVVAAAPDIAPPVTAIISLSPPVMYLDADAGKAAPKVTVPALYAAGAYERTFAEAAKTLYDASTASPDRQLVLAQGSGLHGVSLIVPESGTKDVHDAVAAFLKKYGS